jgi:hypothetical protein
MKVALILLLVAVLATPLARAQTSEITSAELLPAGPHHIGDSLRVHILLTAPRGVTPEIAIVSNPPDDVVWGTVALSTSGESSVKGLAVWEIVWPVQVFRVDPYELPPIEIGVGTDVLLTEPFPVVTVSVREGADADLLRDIRPPVQVFKRTWVPAIVAGVGLLLLAGYKLARRRPRIKPVPEPDAPPQPGALEWAEAEFARMANAQVGDEEALRQFIDDASDVVRGYIARRVGVSALTLTTLETLVALRGSVSGEARAALRETLDGADYVKFAKQIPAQSAGLAFVQRARRACYVCEQEWGKADGSSASSRIRPTELSV